MKNVFAIFFDYFYIRRGKKISMQNDKYKFAFLVHSRSYHDIYRKFPAIKFLPNKLVLFAMNRMWPIRLSKITGLHSAKSGEEIEGYVLGITMTASHMMRHREEALEKIRDAVYLAKGLGAQIVGLGGLTASLSGGGTKLLDIGINITTGHAYTAYNVTNNVFQLVDFFDIDKKLLKIAVVGAAGSVGSTSAMLIAKKGFPHIMLIDIERKMEGLVSLEKAIAEINPEITVEVSNTVRDIANCDFVVTATNTAEALITPALVEDGMVIVDDAQPSDIHSDVLKMENVLAIEGGVVHTPGVMSHFNYGLKSKTDNFCCMAELLILASEEWNSHYVINRATLENVDSIAHMGYNLNFKPGSYQNFLETVSIEKINNVKRLARKKHDLPS